MTLAGMRMLSGLPDNTPHEFKIELVPGSAEAAEDFEPASIVLSMTNMDNQARLPLEIVDDLINEADEDLMLRVTPMASGDIAEEDTQLIILDNDPGPVFSVSDIDVDEDNLAVFTITKEGDAQAVAALTYATQDGTALAGEDYVPTSGILTFAQGEMSKQVIVTGIGDNSFETDEEFYLDLVHQRQVAPSKCHAPKLA